MEGEVSQESDVKSEENIIDTKYRELPLYKHPDFRHNMVNTLVFCYAFVMSGIATTIVGPTLPQLARNVDTSINFMGWVFTGKAVTSIICNVGAGRILDHFQNSSESKKLFVNKLMLIVAPISIALSLCVIPFVPFLWLMVIVNAITEIGTSIVNLVASVLMVWIWKDRVNGPVQLLHFSFGVGGVVAPIIVSATDAIFTAIIGPGKTIQNDNIVVRDKYVHVAAAYIFSAILCLTVIPLVLFVLKQNKSMTKIKNSLQEVELVETIREEDVSSNVTLEENETIESLEIAKKTKRKRIIVSLLIGIALLNYVGAELGYAALIYSYVVEMKHMASETEGSMLTSAFWLSFTIGRLLAVPISSVLSPKNMILLDILGGMISVTFILIWNSNMIAIWICSIAFGVSLASQVCS